MNEDVIQDLKQFIATTISQQLTQQLAGFEIKINKKFDKLGKKIDDVDAKADTILEVLGERIEDHEQRIIKLETVNSTS